MKAARIQDGVVVEVVELPDGVSLAEAYHPSIGFVACPEDTAVGMVYLDGGFAPPPPVVLEGADLDELKRALKAAIDTDAERERLRNITPGDGQALTYMRKVEQARAAIGQTDPRPSDFQLLAATVGIDGATVKEVAQTILARDAAWEQIGAAIEQVRMSAKAAIEAATDMEAARAARDGVIWPPSQ